jgi:hypothetical protein
MKLVMIEWLDSAFCSGWVPKETAKRHTFSKITSVGILLHEDNEKVTIMQDMSDKDDAGDGITIPKVAVTRIRYLKVDNCMDKYKEWDSVPDGVGSDYTR